MNLFAAVSSGDAAVLIVVVGARLVVPLFIPRFPLPAMFAALVIDAADQSIFQKMTDLDLTGYQSYDKALDVYYLAIAYTAVMRNWSSPYQHSVGAFLWYYRLVGVALFEFTQARWLLLVFPNTFEYFYDAIEGARTRWNATRFAHRTVVLIAAGIWIFIKLPQEYWIHVAQLDTTDLIKEDILGVPADTPWSEALAQNMWAYGVIAALIVIVGTALWAIFRRLPRGDWPFTFSSDTVGRRTGWVPAPDHVRIAFFGWSLAEKIALVGLSSVIFFTIYPESDASTFEVFLIAALTVVVNAAVSWWRDRAGRRVRNAVALFAATLLVNLGSLWLFANLFADEGVRVTLRDVSFFAFLIAVLVTYYDNALLHRERCRANEAASVPAA